MRLMGSNEASSRSPKHANVRHATGQSQFKVLHKLNSNVQPSHLLRVLGRALLSQIMPQGMVEGSLVALDVLSRQSHQTKKQANRNLMNLDASGGGMTVFPPQNCVVATAGPEWHRDFHVV